MNLFSFFILTNSYVHFQILLIISPVISVCINFYLINLLGLSCTLVDIKCHSNMSSQAQRKFERELDESQKNDNIKKSNKQLKRGVTYLQG